MRKVHDATGMPPLRRRNPGFEGLARIVVGQQLSVSSANAIWSKCAQRFKPFEAVTLAAADDGALRSAGLSHSKIRSLRAVAQAVIEDRLDLEALGDLEDDDVRTALTAITGIGPWTADIFLLACLGRADAFAAGDLALQKAAQVAFKLSEKPTAHELLERAEVWRPWRSVSARLLWSFYQVIRDQKSGIPV